MKKFGIKVIRFTNEQVLYNQDIVIEQINEFITRVASPALLGEGEGDGRG
jgi:very-short-patch-repair endonuclease